MLKRVVLPLALAAMETGWLFPWVALIGHALQPAAARPLLAAPAILLLLLLARWLLRALVRRRLPPVPLRGALVVAGVAAVLIVVWLDYYAPRPLTDPGWLGEYLRAMGDLLVRFSGPALATIAGLVVWSRGLGLGRGDSDDLEAVARFRFGLLALLAFLVATGLILRGGYDRLIAQTGGVVVGYVFVGLVTLSLARLETVREQGRVRHGAAPALNRHWLGVLLGLVLTLAAITLVVGGLLSVDLVGLLLAPVFRLIGFALWLLVVAVSLPIGWLLEGLIEALRRLLPEALPPPPQGERPARMESLEELLARLNVPPELLQLLQWVATGLIILAGLILLARAIFWWGARERDEEAPEERDSVWSWALPAAALRAWLRRLRDRLRPRRPPPAPAPSAAPAAPAGVLTVREIYRRLLGLGAAAGVPRRPVTTPDAHRPPLGARLAAEEEVAAVTAAYIAARYGPTPPPPGEVEAVRRQWERLAGRPGSDA
jgi:hypothetical protein